MSGLLRLENVSVRFGGLVALDGINLDVPDGRITALIGPNGAGKTTLFNLLTGIYKPTSGNIIFMDRDISRLGPHKRARLGIARTFQHTRLVKQMTVLENVLIAHPECRGERFLDALFLTRRKRERRAAVTEQCMRLLKAVGLDKRAEERAGNLSYGEQRLVEIARALATGCKLLLLDEPAAGMNAAEKKRLADNIRSLATDHAVDLVLIEHDMRLVMDISDHVVVLNHGVKIAEGTPEEIRRNPEVIRAYLGGEEHADGPSA